METVKLEVDPDEARRLYKLYREHRSYGEQMDDEIRKAYRAIAQGKLIIRALESVKAAGLDDKGRPRLALCRADAERVFYREEWNGGATFDMDGWSRGRAAGSRKITMPAGTFEPTKGGNARGCAVLPIIPIHLRPRTELKNYHILWEAEWTPIPPVDPFLLRRIGDSDMWVVLAMWELTEVERAAMATRITVN